MKKGVFEIISDSYGLAAENLFEYSKNSFLILKPFLYFYSLLGFLVLIIGGLVFRVLIVFDYLSKIVNWIRRGIMNEIEGASDRVEHTFLAFLLCPFLISLLTPILILSSIIPKISSELEVDEFSGEILKRMDITANGTFRKIINYCLQTITNMKEYIKKKNVILWIFLLIPFLFNSLLMLFIVLISTPLLLFDFISYLVDSIRMMCIKTSSYLEKSTLNNFWGFLFSPMLLILLLPVFLLVLIIPKFSTGLDVGD